MTEADLVRLALAKRAYEAARPNEAEVLTGVRRARLALRRTKPRRNWLSKGLVFVVLAIGSLAYAKPHALGELIEQALRVSDPARNASEPKAGAALALPPVERHPGLASSPSQARANAAPPAAAAVAAAAVPATPPAAARSKAKSASKAPSVAVAAGPSAHSAADVPATVPSADAATEWGRVGQALARGDERAALLGLNQLAESDDPRTRDKADLGRAQLLLSHGNRDRACALARSLTLRNPGERVERQAQALLKGCNR